MNGNITTQHHVSVCPSVHDPFNILKFKLYSAVDYVIMNGVRLWANNFLSYYFLYKFKRVLFWLDALVG